MPPKPTLDIDMAEFRHMRNLMIKVQDKAVKIKETEAEIADRLDKIPDTLKEDGYPDVQVFMQTFRAYII